MPTTGTKQQLKLKSVVQGKKILKDLSSFLQEILEIATNDTSTYSRNFKKLPEKIKLSIRGVHEVDLLLDQAIKFDGNSRLLKQLIQSSNADENQQRVIQERLQSTPKSKKRKSPCEQRLQSKIASPFPSIKRTKRYKRVQT